MVVGVVKLLIFIPSSNNLKAKRMVLCSLKSRLRNNLNISITKLDNYNK
ncbi:DUF503 family protein [bacterium]|nr:DUF503 family protein [bacterium]